MKKISLNKRLLFHYSLLLFLFSLFCHVSGLQAATVKEIKPLSFGTIALKDNNASYIMRIAFSGQVSVDSSIIIIDSGHPALWELNGFPQHTPINISFIVPDIQTQLAGATDPPTSQFTITEHHTFGPIITTDAFGNALFNVGATLTTSGSGFYKDATYLSHMTVMVSY